MQLTLAYRKPIATTITGILGMLGVGLFALVFTASAVAQDSGVVVLEQEIEIKADIQVPQAIISLSRSRPEFMVTTVDSVKANYAETGFSLVSDFIDPPEEDKLPRKIEDLKTLLAKERE